MKLTFVNVGYGEAILLECPDPVFENGKFVMLIDGGSMLAEEFIGSTTGRQPLAEYLRAENITHIDLMVCTHIHEDHVCGLLPAAQQTAPAALWQLLGDGILAQMRPLDPAEARTVSQRNFMLALNAHRQLCSLLSDAGRPVRPLCAGAEGTLCEGLTYRILSPSAKSAAGLEDDLRRLYHAEGDAFFDLLDELDRNMNNHSLILLLDYHGTRLLLPGDTNARGYEEIDPAALQSDLFKVGHHGQRDGTDQTLLDAVRPKVVVCCASSDRRYNSAHPDVMSLLRQSGAELYFSDCPAVSGTNVPAHRALTFSVGANGALSAEYIP